MTLEQKRHLGVYAIVCHKDAVLLVKKTRGPYEGKWDLPGGSFHHGESIFSALKREIKEETSLELQDECFCFWDNLTALFEKEQLSLYHIGLLYVVKSFDINQIDTHLCFEDVQGAKWFSFHTDPSEPLTPFAQVVISNFKVI